MNMMQSTLQLNTQRNTQFNKQRIKKANLFESSHYQRGYQLDIVNFESPLQQVLQQQSQLLNLLNQQNKWQLWLSCRPMLKRSWLKNAGLNENKIMNVANVNNDNMIQFIEKALLNRTFSYIVACIEQPLSQHEKQRLQIAVKNSGTHLFLIDDNHMNYNDFMTLSLKINSYK